MGVKKIAAHASLRAERHSTNSTHEANGGAAGVVLISQPVHQHGYETAVAAQEAGLLRAFVTGIYYTKRGVMSPRLRRRLPSGLQKTVELELMRRQHDELRLDSVYTIPRYHIIATALRRAGKFVTPLRRLELDSWAHLRFDEAVGQLLSWLPGLRIVHAFEGSGLETLRAAKELGIATVLDVTSAQDHACQVRSESGTPTMLERIREEHELADVLFVPSEYAMNCLIGHGVARKKILKIPYGVDHERFSPARRKPEEDRPFRVLYAGRIGPDKGVQYLLDAWRRLGLRDAQLVLVGEPDRAGRALLREFRGSYVWPGSVPKHAVDQWFKAADLFVFPSLSDSWGLAVTEAMACGLPVVCTANTGAPVRDGIDGFVVPPRDVEALQDRLRLLYETPAARREMGARGRRLVMSSYTWQDYRTKVAEAYRSILLSRFDQMESLPRLEATSW